MMLEGFDSSPMGHTNHKGQIPPPSSAIPHAGHMGNDLIVGWVDEARELNFSYWSEAVDGHPHSCTDDGRFSEGRIKTAFVPIFLLQTDCSPENSAFDINVFSKNHNVRVTGHFQIQGVVDSANQIHEGHLSHLL